MKTLSSIFNDHADILLAAAREGYKFAVIAHDHKSELCHPCRTKKQADTIASKYKKQHFNTAVAEIAPKAQSADKALKALFIPPKRQHGSFSF